MYLVPDGSAYFFSQILNFNVTEKIGLQQLFRSGKLSLISHGLADDDHDDATKPDMRTGHQHHLFYSPPDTYEIYPQKLQPLLM